MKLNFMHYAERAVFRGQFQYKVLGTILTLRITTGRAHARTELHG